MYYVYREKPGTPISHPINSITTSSRRRCRRRRRSSREHRGQTRDRRLRRKIRSKQIRRAKARKRGRHPRILIIKVPHREADTRIHIQTGLGRHGIISRLLRELRVRRGRRHPHIQLRDGDLDAQRGEGLHIGHLRRVGRRLVADEVRLQADAVDADALGLQAGDERLRRRALVAGELDVVVVVVELGRGVGGGGGAEGGGDVGGAGRVVPDVGAVGAVVVEGFVDHVPRVALALVVADDVGDVVLQDAEEGGVVEVAGCEPGRVLVVPVQVVAARDHAGIEGGLDDGVAFGVIEHALGGLCGIPLLQEKSAYLCALSLRKERRGGSYLLSIGWSDLPEELWRITERILDVLWILEVGVVYSSAEILEPGCLC